jgi:prevent-host-death family protein
MAFVGIRDLSRDTSRVIREFEESGEPLIITREGKPIGALMPVTERQVEDIVLATAPEFRPAAREPGQPRDAQPLDEYAAEQGVILDEEADGAENAEPVEFVEVFAGEAAKPSVVAAETAQFAELSASAAESVLEPFAAIFSAPLAAQVVSAAREQLGAVNSEAFAVIGGEQRALGEIREVSDLTAGLYGRVFRRRLQSTLLREPALDAVREAAEAAGNVLRDLNHSVSGVPNLSLPTYTALFHAAEILWDEGQETGEVEAAAPVEPIA